MTQPNETNFQALLVKIAKLLNEFDIDYAITGGYAVSIWGRPRSTLDIDALVQLSGRQVGVFSTTFQQHLPDLYVDEQMIREAVARGGEFNIIDPVSGIKIDF